jgi:hypothetical protein
LRVTPTQGAGLMDFYHRTNYGQNEPVKKAILIFNEYWACLVFVMMKVGMLFVMASVALWRAVSSIVIAEAISMAVFVSLEIIFFL